MIPVYAVESRQRKWFTGEGHIKFMLWKQKEIIFRYGLFFVRTFVAMTLYKMLTDNK